MQSDKLLRFASQFAADARRWAANLTLEDLGNLGEVIAAVATVATFIYLSAQIRASNRLGRVEASRAPTADLNSLNAAFGTDPIFRAAMREILNGAQRSDLEPDQQMIADFYFISLTNIQEQLAREAKAGVLPSEAADYSRTGILQLLRVAVVVLPMSR